MRSWGHARGQREGARGRRRTVEGGPPAAVPLRHGKYPVFAQKSGGPGGPAAPPGSPVWPWGRSGKKRAANLALNCAGCEPNHHPLALSGNRLRQRPSNRVSSGFPACCPWTRGAQPFASHGRPVVERRPPGEGERPPSMAATPPDTPPVRAAGTLPPKRGRCLFEGRGLTRHVRIIGRNEDRDGGDALGCGDGLGQIDIAPVLVVNASVVIAKICRVGHH